MARARIELQVLLEEVLGSRNVYFQPPESLKLHYPCIVYERSDLRIDRANNHLYRKKNCYTVTVIDRNPDSEILDRMAELEYCGFDRHFVSDNLNHDVFRLYF